MERDFIKLNLGPTLEKAGLKDKVKIMIHDDQRDTLVNWTHTVLSDKEAAKYVSGIAFHWYHNDRAPVEILDQVAAAFPDYFILNTEACIETKNPKKEVLSLGEWEQGERYAYDIITVSF